MFNKNIMNKNAFTIVELSVVLVIVSILISGYFAFTVKLGIDEKMRRNEAKMDKIVEAIQKYYNINGYIPCPAFRCDALDSSAFGKSGGATGSCSSGGAVCIYSTNTATNDEVLIGAVPVRTLGLSDSAAFDEWGNRFRYSTVLALAKTKTEFEETPVPTNSIDVLNRSGASANANISGHNSIAYVLISHGPNGVGAYGYYDGGVNISCSGGAETENCDDDDTFLDAPYEPNQTDDFIRWETKQKLMYNSFVAAGTLGSGAENFSKYALFKHLNGGNVGIGSTGWQTRQLNSTIHNSLSNSGSLSGNQIRLGRGTYYMKATAVGCSINGHSTRIVTSSVAAPVTTIYGEGQAAYASSTTDDCTSSEAYLYITVTYPVWVYVQSYVTTANASFGFGRAAPSTPYEHVKLEIWEL
jgi:prepilin-type N-terminal cleavage/methylation domain-containing protein